MLDSSKINPNTAFKLFHGHIEHNHEIRDSSGLFQKSSPNQKDIGLLIKILASRFGIGELVAMRLLRKLMASSTISLVDIRNFIEKISNRQNLPKMQVLFQELAKEETQSISDIQFTKLIRPLLKTFEKYVTNLQNSQNQSDLFFPQASPITKLVSSPREFASWLVNNKAAFIALRSNPELTYILTALQNPLIKNSPALTMELLKLMVQILRLKSGKLFRTEVEEKIKEEKDLQDSLDMDIHEQSIVNTVRDTVNNVAVKPLRDFLIEAERFAEEEIANLWSLTLKKEKELEKRLKTGLNKLKKKNVRSKR